MAISGIDASGKGHTAELAAAALRRLGQRAVVLNADGWLNLPAVRFNATDPGGHFYRHALRLEEMFTQLVLPLRDRRRIRVTVDFTEETATAYRRHVYEFPEIDVVLLEGIFLLKPQYRAHYDLSAWIDCTFTTALERAIVRGQEGLPEDETIKAFETIYFPAQRIHFELDRPREAAGFIVPNDPRLSEEAAAGSLPAGATNQPAPEPFTQTITTP